MMITIKSKQNSDLSPKVLDYILTNSIEDLSDYVDRIIVCDEEDLENEIKLWDDSITITKLIGCTVNGKTISHSDKSIIFVTTNILLNLYNNIVVQDNSNIIYKDESLCALRTFYHEIGHAKRNHNYGNIITKKITHSYEEMMNELWNIMRDEYFAEMCCANIIKLKKSFEWYGNFNDDVESDNYEYYLSAHYNNELKLDGNIALQLMHQYYFVPLFQKVGFLEGASKLIPLKNISVCRTIQDIRNCNVADNKYVPLEFNDIILRKWSDFKIEDKLNGRY